jgi:hypothetical protein
MKKCISLGVTLAMLVSLAGPAAARESDGPPGRLVGDLASGRLSFQASNGFRIEGMAGPDRFTVTVTDDLGLESVRFQLEPPRRSLRRSEIRLHVGGATWIHRTGVSGATGEVELRHPDGRRARHADRPGRPGSPLAGWAPEYQDAYRLLQEVALGQASLGFWEGLGQLFGELEVTHNPAACELACLSCVAAILAYVASIGLLVSCGPAAGACVLPILAHLGQNASLVAHCTGCLLCLEDHEEEEERDRGAGGLTPDVQL